MAQPAEQQSTQHGDRTFVRQVGMTQRAPGVASAPTWSPINRWRLGTPTTSPRDVLPFPGGMNHYLPLPSSHPKHQSLSSLGSSRASVLQGVPGSSSAGGSARVCAPYSHHLPRRDLVRFSSRSRPAGRSLSPPSFLQNQGSLGHPWRLGLTQGRQSWGQYMALPLPALWVLPTSAHH